MKRDFLKAMGLAGLLAAGSGTLLTGCMTVGATGEQHLNMVGEEREIQMGREADVQIVAAMGLYPDKGLQNYVKALGERIAATAERPDLPWSFRVVDNDVVNAFALPGGFIYVTRGILATLGSEAELAGVIGHEIGHVTAMSLGDPDQRDAAGPARSRGGRGGRPRAAELPGPGGGRTAVDVPEVQPRR